MPNRVDSAFAARLLPLAIALLLAGAAPAAAQNEPTAFHKFLGGLGLLEIPSDNRPDYRERAPLVVPPSNALIQPRNSDDITKYNPDWPLDHNNRPRKAADSEAERKADDDFYSGRALSPAELSRGRISREEAARRAATTSVPEPAIKAQQPLSPSQLGFKGWGSKQEEKVVFSGEPERRSLTDPPTGLRTPSQDAPYGVLSNKAAPAKASTLYDRVTSPNDPVNRQ
ncbi:MAG: hypothetical protein WD207_03510 [Xanthobacteraceae bacterium]